MLFLDRLEMNAYTDGIGHDALLRNAHRFLGGKAADDFIYWGQGLETWDDFVDGLIEATGCKIKKTAIMEKIAALRQGQGDTFKVFSSRMMSLFRRLNPPLTDDEQLTYMMRGMKPQLHTAIVGFNIQNVYDLINAVNLVSENLERAPQRQQQPFFQRGQGNFGNRQNFSNNINAVENQDEQSYELQYEEPPTEEQVNCFDEDGEVIPEMVCYIQGLFNQKPTELKGQSFNKPNNSGNQNQNGQQASGNGKFFQKRDTNQGGKGNQANQQKAWTNNVSRSKKQETQNAGNNNQQATTSTRNQNGGNKTMPQKYCVICKNDSHWTSKCHVNPNAFMEMMTRWFETQTRNAAAAQNRPAATTTNGNPTGAPANASPVEDFPETQGDNNPQ